MGRMDKSYVYNAGKRDHTKPMIVFYNGERRRQLWPAGTVERFVNLQGAVVQHVLVAPGVPASKEAVAQARAKVHALETTDGETVAFVEHGKCPMKTGIRELDERLADEFEIAFRGIPACKDHPVTFKKTAKGIEYFDGCPHIQALIKHRREKHAALVSARMKRQQTLQEIEQAKLAAAQAQAEATTKLLERVAEKLDRPEPKTRKQAPESGE